MGVVQLNKVHFMEIRELATDGFNGKTQEVRYVGPVHGDFYFILILSFKTAGFFLQSEEEGTEFFFGGFTPEEQHLVMGRFELGPSHFKDPLTQSWKFFEGADDFGPGEPAYIYVGDGFGGIAVFIFA